MFKQFVQRKLERYVKKYFNKHPEVKLVAVAGSVGKTSTKRAIATLLSQKYRVGMHEGNHNMNISAPVAIMGVKYPENVHSISAWLSVFAAMRERIRQPSGVDVIVVELGTDHPGEIAAYGKYLRPDISVITAVTAEHMEFFGTIEAVAAEEIEAANFSKLAIINRDDVEGRFADLLTNSNVDTYGTTGAAEYRFEIKDFSVEKGYIGQVITSEYAEPITATIKVVGEHSLRPPMGAVAVACKLGLNPTEIAAGLKLIRATPGRMNLLRGFKNSTIIDDTYNSSPLSASSALQTLYSLQAPQRIAILGTMNELGASSQVEHEKLGAMCDPSLLAWVITVGNEAEKYLAPAAKARGCPVRSFKTAIEAGAFVHKMMEKDAAILAKGSQGDVYLEEAVKVLALMTEGDELVRQSPAWLETKEKFFSKFEGQ
jgi:UDP-N-acetylmuramoyl-tripeptide--D-alanyl-D-alanine ligase